MGAMNQCILDFDNTLFDTKRFIRFLQDRGQAVPEAQAELGALLRQVAPLGLDLTPYVFPGVSEFIQDLRHKSWRVDLLSKGNPEWQEWKIRNSGVWGDSQNYFLVSDDKTDRLEQVVATRAGVVYFVNDNWHETLGIRRLHPEFSYLLKVRRDHEKFYRLDEVDVPYFHDFQELRVTEDRVVVTTSKKN